MPKFLYCMHISAFVYSRINSGIQSHEHYQSLLLLLIIKWWLNPSEFVIMHVSIHLKKNIECAAVPPSVIKIQTGRVLR